MCLVKNAENETYFFNNTEIENSSEGKILGIIIDNKLNFKSHVKKYVREFLKRSGLCHVLQTALTILKKAFNVIIKSSSAIFQWFGCLVLDKQTT